MHNLKELKIWSKAIDLAVEMYKVTERFPSVEKFGLISQVRRSAFSISSNIAERAGRNSSGEFIQFPGISNGSCYALRSQLLVSER